MLNTILPLEANNNYQGAKIAMWFFIVFVCLMTWRSVIHMLFEEYGMHGIANFKVLTGDPDPMPFIYMFFSTWGLAQLIFCAVCWIVIFRYRSLIPLMYLFWILEWGTRTFLYPIMTGDLIAAGEYSNGPTPGHVIAPFVTIILLAMFFLSTRQKDN